ARDRPPRVGPGRGAGRTAGVRHGRGREHVSVPGVCAQAGRDAAARPRRDRRGAPHNHGVRVPSGHGRPRPHPQRAHAVRLPDGHTAANAAGRVREAEQPREAKGRAGLDEQAEPLVPRAAGHRAGEPAGGGCAESQGRVAGERAARPDPRQDHSLRADTGGCAGPGQPAPLPSLHCDGRHGRGEAGAAQDVAHDPRAAIHHGDISPQCWLRLLA
ncbi:hypothetical protein GMDG_08821, partial [Pseudogymnoascus destructans 20631-21]